MTKHKPVRNSLDNPDVRERVELFAKQYLAGTATSRVWPDYNKMRHLALVAGLIRPSHYSDDVWNKKSRSYLGRLVKFFMRYNAGKITARHDTHLYRVAKSCGAINTRRRGRHHRRPEVEAEMDRIVLEQHARGASLREMSEASGYSHEKCRRVVLKAGLETNYHRGGCRPDNRRATALGC